MVKGHDGVEGNELADNGAKWEIWMGERMHKPDIVILAGIRQAYPLHSKAPDHLSWSRQAIRDLTYLETDKNPPRQWLKEIGKVEDASCVCGGWTPQNAAYMYACLWVGDGAGRVRDGKGAARWGLPSPRVRSGVRGDLCTEEGE